MKFAISTLPFKTWSVEEIIKPCVEAGYHALEIRMDFHEWSHISLPDHHFEALLKTIKAAGMEVIDLGSSVRIYNYNAAAIDDMKRLFEVANILQAKGIRIMFRHNPDAPATEEDYQGLCKWIAEVDVLAGEANIEVWLETHGDYSSGAACARIFNDVPLKHTKIIWDYMHTLETGETTEESMAYIMQYTAHVHIKDGYKAKHDGPAHLQGQWKHSKLGGGEVPNQYFVELLQGAGYDGYYSLEWESAWRKELLDLDCDPEQIAFYPVYMKMFDTKKD